MSQIVLQVKGQNLKRNNKERKRERTVVAAVLEVNKKVWLVSKISLTKLYQTVLINQ